MTLGALLERYAQFEKRGLGLYRGLAERFAAESAAARLWREMSNTEASHFALFELTQDWVAMAGGGSAPPAATAEHLDALALRMGEIEDRAADPRTTLAAAVTLTIDWEELELPRILELLPHLPARAQGRVLAGMIGEAAEHYRLLSELAGAAGTARDAERIAALGSLARSALG
jgi:hypothetical protein